MPDDQKKRITMRVDPELFAHIEAYRAAVEANSHLKNISMGEISTALCRIALEMWRQETKR